MKKIKMLLIICTIVFVSLVIICLGTNDNNVLIENKSTSKSSGSSAISMMYETEAGSGVYEVSTDSVWPAEGYKFNDTLSKCENGSTLTWNEDTKSVIMTAGLSDRCYVYFDKKTLADACLLEDMASCIVENYTLDSAIYYHDRTLANSANDRSYRYAGGDYELTSTATSAGYTRLVTAVNTETDGLINFYCNGSKSYVGDSCSTSDTYYYTVAGSGSYTTYQAALDAAVSQGYLTQDNVKNFVCFGSDATPCPIDNLYRIIGVFDDDGNGNYQVKLIKYDYATSDLLGTDGDFSDIYTYHYSGVRGKTPSTHYLYYWNANGTNTWSESQLNTVNLNTNYINNISENWANKIALTAWSVGGNSWSNIGTQAAATAYQNEIVSPAENTIYDAKIGLMYVSDYMYAADSNNWTYLGYDSAAIDYRVISGSNWMYMGYGEWTISRDSDDELNAFLVDGDGNVGYFGVDGGLGGVRPSFYLESGELITGGSGTMSDPYRSWVYVVDDF